MYVDCLNRKWCLAHLAVAEIQTKDVLCQGKAFSLPNIDILLTSNLAALTFCMLACFWYSMMSLLTSVSITHLCGWIKIGKIFLLFPMIFIPISGIGKTVHHHRCYLHDPYHRSLPGWFHTIRCRNQWWEFSVPQIEYPLGRSSKKGSHVYFLLQVFWKILLFCNIVLLFDINVVLMLPWWPDVTIVQSDVAIVVPWQLSTGSIYDYHFC